MTFPKALGGAAAAVAWLAAAPQAAALNFHFSFVNAMNGGGAVSGMIFGLSEGTGPAAGVWVTGNTAGFGFGDFVGAPRVNSWTVTDGQITDFDFMAFGSDNGPGEVRDAALMFGTFEFIPGQTNRAGLSSDPFSIISARTGVSTADMGLRFMPRATVAREAGPDDPAAVPAPPALAALGLGLLALAGLARRRSIASGSGRG